MLPGSIYLSIIFTVATTWSYLQSVQHVLVEWGFMSFLLILLKMSPPYLYAYWLLLIVPLGTVL